jgi:hypothetical protein
VKIARLAHKIKQTAILPLFAVVSQTMHNGKSRKEAKLNFRMRTNNDVFDGAVMSRVENAGKKTRD